MYKKILSLLLIVNCSLLIVVPMAQAATPTPQDKTQQIRDQLITNIASRVAALKLVEKRGIIGKVTGITNTQITVDVQNNTRFVDVDELTKFSSPNSKGTYGISDITKNTTVGILGLYNKESRRILARFVNAITTPFIIIHGGVAAIDSENFSINITTEEGKQISVDIENLTRTYSYTQKTGYLRSGFSKIKENYNIIVTGVLDTKDKNKVIATRVIFFPEIPASPKVNSMLDHVNKSSK